MITFDEPNINSNSTMQDVQREFTKLIDTLNYMATVIDSLEEQIKRKEGK